MPGYCVCVTTADCVPVLLYDKKQHVVAAVHAGWKGTVKHIVSNVTVSYTHLGATVLYFTFTKYVVSLLGTPTDFTFTLASSQYSSGSAETLASAS